MSHVGTCPMCTPFYVDLARRAYSLSISRRICFVLNPYPFPAAPLSLISFPRNAPQRTFGGISSRSKAALINAGRGSAARRAALLDAGSPPAEAGLLRDTPS